MTPYHTFRLTERPDVRTLKAEGRSTLAGALPFRLRGYIRRAAVKRATRRALKRGDRQRDLREELSNA